MNLIQPTSIEAYRNLLPVLGDRQQEVLTLIAEHPCIDNWEISKRLRLPISSITPRTRELVKMGCVEQGDTHTQDDTGETVIGWQVCPELPMPHVVKARKAQMKEARISSLRAGKQTAALIDFIQQVKSGQRAMYYGPDFVVMGRRQFDEMQEAINEGITIVDDDNPQGIPIAKKKQGRLL